MITETGDGSQTIGVTLTPNFITPPVEIPPTQIDERVQALTGVSMAQLSAQTYEASLNLSSKKSFLENLEADKKIKYAETVERIRAELTATGEKVTESKIDNLAQSDPAYKAIISLISTTRTIVAELEAKYYFLRNQREDIHAQIGLLKSEMYLER